MSNMFSWLRTGNKTFYRLFVPTGLQNALADNEDSYAPVVSATSLGFDVKVQPAVSNAVAYTAGDIMGGLLTFDTGFRGQMVMIQEAHIVFKKAVTPSLRLVLFDADPTATTKTDNSPYSLNAADAFKARKTISMSVYNTHAAAIRSSSIGGLGLPFQLAAGDSNIYGLLVDDTGVTLDSTSAVQVSLKGLR